MMSAWGGYGDPAGCRLSLSSFVIPRKALQDKFRLYGLAGLCRSRWHRDKPLIQLGRGTLVPHVPARLRAPITQIWAAWQDASPPQHPPPLRHWTPWG